MYKKLITILIAAIAHITPLQAEETKPLWEFGIGIAILNFPDYRGSQNQQNYSFPLPYFIYRGEKFKVNRQGVRGLLYHSERLTFDISLDGGVPVDSDDNRIRQGMPDLDPVFEIGPSLKILLAQNPAKTRKLSLRLPIRAAFATDLSYIHNEGWLFHPHLGFDTFIGATRDWKFGISAGPLYANKDYHQYYYGVAPKYATSTRPAYTAKGGYSGARFTLAVSRQLKNLWFGAFVRYDDLQNTAFEDSPLLEQKNSLMAGFGIAWVLKRSQHQVYVTSY